MQGGNVLIKCCNPKCEAPFDYREGRLMRFSSKQSRDKTTEAHLKIQHFWLCGKCAGLFDFESESGITITIKPRQKELSEEKHSHFVSAA
jgi:hypothetical protein